MEWGTKKPDFIIIHQSLHYFVSGNDIHLSFMSTKINKALRALKAFGLDDLEEIISRSSFLMKMSDGISISLLTIAR